MGGLRADWGGARRVGQGLEDPGPAGSGEWGRGMTERRSGSNRFGWLTDEEDPRTEEALREETPPSSGAVAATTPATTPATAPAGVPDRVTGGASEVNRIIPG